MKIVNERKISHCSKHQKPDSQWGGSVSETHKLMPKKADFEVKHLAMEMWIFYHEAVYLSFRCGEMAWLSTDSHTGMAFLPPVFVCMGLRQGQDSFPGSQRGLK